MKRLVIMRASHVSPDPRVERAAAVASSTGLDVHVLACWDRAGDLTPSERRRDFSVVRYRRTAQHGRGLRDLLGLVLFQWFLLRRTLRDRRSLAAIHACDLSTGITGLLLARLLRVPRSTTCSTTTPTRFPVPRSALPVVRRIETFVIQNADEVILASGTRIAQIAPAQPHSLTIVENSPDLEMIPAANLPLTDLGYVGILARGRLLLEVARAVAEDATLSLRIAGFGPLENEVAAIADRAPNIEYLGKVDANRALQVLASSVVMFATYDPKVPNHRYSVPNKLAEALALGKPLIVCSGTSIDRQVEAAGIGRVIEYDVDEFMSAARSLVGDQGVLHRCATEGPRLYVSEHSWPVNARRLREVYRRAVLGGTAP